MASVSRVHGAHVGCTILGGVYPPFQPEETGARTNSVYLFPARIASRTNRIGGASGRAHPVLHDGFRSAWFIHWQQGGAPVRPPGPRLRS